MSTYTFFSDLNDAVTFARQQQKQHGRVAAIKPYTYGEGTTGRMEGHRVEMFRGLVIHEREMNGYDDSDFFAVWFDAETGESGEFMFGSTRGWTYANGCTVDAPQEVRDAYFAKQEASRQAAAERSRQAEKDAEAKLPLKGAMVRVKSKRSKVAHGTEGEVFFFGASKFARQDLRNCFAGPNVNLLENLGNYRVGFQDAEGNKHFLAATAVEVLQPVTN